MEIIIICGVMDKKFRCHVKLVELLLLGNFMVDYFRTMLEKCKWRIWVSGFMFLQLGFDLMVWLGTWIYSADVGNELYNIMW